LSSAEAITTRAPRRPADATGAARSAAADPTPLRAPKRAAPMPIPFGSTGALPAARLDARVRQGGARAAAAVGTTTETQAILSVFLYLAQRQVLARPLPGEHSRERARSPRLHS